MAGQQKYLAFCSAVHHPLLPAYEHTFLLFITHLAVLGLSHTIIKVYLAAVRNLCIATGQQAIYGLQFTLCLQQVLKS